MILSFQSLPGTVLDVVLSIAIVDETRKGAGLGDSILNTGFVQFRCDDWSIISEDERWHLYIFPGWSASNTTMAEK
jgi:hypothetical protein